MLEIGNTIESLPLGSDEAQIAGVAASLNHNKLEVYHCTTIIDNGAAADTNTVVAWIPYDRWRVIGLGFRCHTEAYTDGLDPEFRFGSPSDNDLFGILKGTLGGSDKVIAEDVIAHSVGDILPNVDTEGGVTVSFTAGDPDGRVTWQAAPGEIAVENVAQLAQGQGYVFVLVEIDTGGEY
jgi:hypothetical protein